MSNHGLLAIVTTAQRANLNFVFDAMGLGPDNFSRRITNDVPATSGSTVTQYGLYNASALAGDALLYENAKAGFLPNTDVNGDPIYWGVNGVIDEAAALAAFAAMQFWLNSSDVEPLTFANAVLAAAGLSYVPSNV